MSALQIRFIAVFVAFLSGASILNAQTTPKTSAPPPPGDTIQRFVKALRAGNAAGMRAELAPPSNPSGRADLDRWITSMVKIGPTLTAEQFVAARSATQIGDFATVVGTFGDAGYLCLVRATNGWRIVPQGVNAATYLGLDSVKAKQLASLERAASEAVARERAKQSPPKPVSSDASDSSTQPVIVPEDKPATRPGSEVANAAVGELIKILASDDKALHYLSQLALIHLLLETGDVESATRLYEVAELSIEKLECAGWLSTMLPGGPQGQTADGFFSRHRVELAQHGTLTGVVLGLAKAGKTREVLVWTGRESDKSWKQTTLRRVLTMCPEQPYLDALLKTEPLMMGNYDAAPLLRAYLILSQEENARKFIEEIRAAETADQMDFKARFRVNKGEADSLIFRAVFFAHLTRAEFDKAMALEKVRFDTQMAAVPQAKDKRSAEFEARMRRFEAYEAIIAAHALKGDMESIRECRKVVSDYPVADSLNVPIAYAIARSSDAAKTDASLDALPDKFRAGSNKYYAVLGAAAAGRRDVGDVDSAQRCMQKGLTQIATLQKDDQRADAVFNLLMGLWLGPEALIQRDHSRDAFRIRLALK